MKHKELIALTKEELARRYKECRSDLFRLKVRFATEQVENPREKRTLRHEMARIKTILRQREIELEKANVKG